jgi:uncharacterized DUF497 family protein
MEFEWDPNKAARNIRKHGVSFEEAASVFNDEYAAVYEDPAHSSSERRYLIIGQSTNTRLVIVAYRDQFERIRIINARRVTRRERVLYEEEDR